MCSSFYSGGELSNPTGDENEENREGMESAPREMKDDGKRKKEDIPPGARTSGEKEEKPSWKGNDVKEFFRGAGKGGFRRITKARRRAGANRFPARYAGPPASRAGWLPVGQSQRLPA